MSLTVDPLAFAPKEQLLVRTQLIHLDDLIFSGKHGVGTDERLRSQPFSLSIKLGVDIRSAAVSDRIGDTINYCDIKEIVRKVIEEESYHLLEKIANQITSKILMDERIQSVEVTIRKLAIWSNGIPGVTTVVHRI